MKETMTVAERRAKDLAKSRKIRPDEFAIISSGDEVRIVTPTIRPKMVDGEIGLLGAFHLLQHSPEFLKEMVSVYQQATQTNDSPVLGADGRPANPTA